MTNSQKSVENYIKNLMKNESEIMVKPFHYMYQHQATDTVPILAFALNQWLNIPDEKLNKVVEIVKLLRDSAILLDDIQDESVARDGFPVAHRVFGTASTITSAVYGCFLAIKKATEIGHPEAVKICYEETMNFHRGQGTEIHWRDNVICPTEKEYKKMVLAKTSCFASIIARLMQLFSKNTKNYDEFCLLLGYYMQAKNDYCNLMCECTEKEIFCEDITDGKFSFPIVHAINQNNADAARVLDIVKQKTSDNAPKIKCLKTMDKLGSLSYSRDVINSLYETLRSMISDLGPNKMMLDMLCEFHKCQTTL